MEAFIQAVAEHDRFVRISDLGRIDSESPLPAHFCRRPGPALGHFAGSAVIQTLLRCRLEVSESDYQWRCQRFIISKASDIIEQSRLYCTGLPEPRFLPPIANMERNTHSILLFTRLRPVRCHLQQQRSALSLSPS